jgi:hypothetical protein
VDGIRVIHSVVGLPLLLHWKNGSFGGQGAVEGLCAT